MTHRPFSHQSGTESQGSPRTQPASQNPTHWLFAVQMLQSAPVKDTLEAV